MLQEPREEIYDVIRYFGQRQDLQHPLPQHPRPPRRLLRNAIPTKGDMDMLAVARTLQEVGYPYMLMPDHMPHHADDPDSFAGVRLRLRVYQGAVAGDRAEFEIREIFHADSIRSSCAKGACSK